MTAYDVVVVGGRVAGASTALLLARAGLSVALVDRGRRGSDTLSTHALMRAGVLQLARWGILADVLAAGTPPVRHTVFHYSDGEEVDVPIRPRAGVDALYAPRRHLLDGLLLDAAERAGVRVLEATTVLGLRRDATARRALADTAATALVEAFMTLGPTFVKLGQMIASSPGMFPAPLADACLRTLDDVPPFPAHEALAIVEDDLGAPASALFAEVDSVPLSAASIAQVHGCILLDGRAAVLKIQRPDIAARMNRDLLIMYSIARLVDRTRTGHLLNAPGIVEDLHQVTNEELDFAIQKVTASIEPIIIVFLAVVVGFIIAAVLLPLLDFSNI